DPRRRPLLRHRSLCPLVRALPISTLFPYTTLFRSSLPLFGDGFVEAVADEDLLKIAKLQRESTGGQIHGQAISVDIAEVKGAKRDRKSTRLNSSHGSISYAVFCLKKKKRTVAGILS